jgi:hypothetical protein
VPPKQTIKPKKQFHRQVDRLNFTPRSEVKIANVGEQEEAVEIADLNAAPCSAADFNLDFVS